MPDDDESKGPIGQAIDVLVYAPIGLFFEGSTVLQKLVEDGKGHARGARVFGEFAVKQGRAELGRRLSSFEEQAGEVLRTLGVLPDDDATGPGSPPPPGTGARSAGGPPAARRSATSSSTSTSSSTAGAGGTTASTGVHGATANGNGAAPAPADDAPAVHELAITDYDSLSASQVVVRLEGLAVDELEAVRAYESAHRGRKTILNKVAQLQG
jgi:hypothetical protein